VTRSWPHSLCRRYECKTWRNPVRTASHRTHIWTYKLSKTKQACYTIMVRWQQMALHQLLASLFEYNDAKTLCTLTRLSKSRSCSYTCHEGIKVKLTQAPIILTPTQIGGEQSASRLGRFTDGERAPATLWIGGWVGPTASLDILGKRANSYPAGI